MDNVIHLVTPQPKYYLVHLVDGRVVRVKANSYDVSTYATYSFYTQTNDEVSKADMKGLPCSPIFEIARRYVESVSEEGVVEIPKEPTSIKTPKKKKVAKAVQAITVKKSRKKS